WPSGLRPGGAERWFARYQAVISEIGACIQDKCVPDGMPSGTKLVVKGHDRTKIDDCGYHPDCRHARCTWSWNRTVALQPAQRGPAESSRIRACPSRGPDHDSSGDRCARQDGTRGVEAGSLAAISVPLQKHSALST